MKIIIALAMLVSLSGCPQQSVRTMTQLAEFSCSVSDFRAFHEQVYQFAALNDQPGIGRVAFKAVSTLNLFIVAECPAALIDACFAGKDQAHLAAGLVEGPIEAFGISATQTTGKDGFKSFEVAVTDQSLYQKTFDCLADYFPRPDNLTNLPHVNWVQRPQQKAQTGIKAGAYF